MKRIGIMLAALLALTLAGCTKEVVGTSGRAIGSKFVEPEAGSFPVAITTHGVWHAQAEADWIHVNEEYKSGNYAITVNYDSNESTPILRRFNRRGAVVVKTYDGFTADTIYIFQRGLDVVMQLEDTLADKEQLTAIVPLRTNLTDEQRYAMTFNASAAWVKSISFGSDGKSLIANIEKNSGNERSCTVKMVFTDGWNEKYETECTLTQR